MDFREIESAAFRSWPALEELETEGIVLRYSNGYTKRANSANVLQQQHGEHVDVVRRCEQFFEEKGLPCIFRLPDFCNNSTLDAYLELNGYRPKYRSLVLYRKLEGSSFNSSDLAFKTPQDWMESYCRLSVNDLDNHEPHFEILKRIKDNVLMAVLIEDHKEVACGIGVISKNYFGMFDVITEKESRKRGYGEKLLNGMLSWAVYNGASKAYIQVVSGNLPAINLYRKLGYENCYAYWYRIKDDVSNTIHSTNI